MHARAATAYSSRDSRAGLVALAERYLTGIHGQPQMPPDPRAKSPPVVRLLTHLDDAELVAFRVGHDEVIRYSVLQVLADHGRACLGQALDRLQHASPADLLRLTAAAA
jgi:hypothetical protein